MVRTFPPMTTGGPQGIPPPPDSASGGDARERVVTSREQAAQVWAAGQERADTYDVRAEYEQDPRRTADLRRAALLLRWL